MSDENRNAGGSDKSKQQKPTEPNKTGTAGGSDEESRNRERDRNK
jgi:hypothetical protein